MVEALCLKECHKVLEIGAGSGYAAAIMAEIASPSCGPGGPHKVFTIEIDPVLVAFAKDNLQRCGYSDRVEVIQGDGCLGLPQESPFDKIMVSAAASDVPSALIEQLADEGEIVIPVGGRFWSQELYLLRKWKDGKVTKKYLMDVMFVPLRNG